MDALLPGLRHHRAHARTVEDVCHGEVRFSLVKALWFLGMLAGAAVGGFVTFSAAAFCLFLVSTAWVLLFGHSLGSHRKLIHDSFQSPKWLEYFLVYCGVLVGLAGPLGLMRQHELRDYAQRLPICHDYLRHGRKPLMDAWWQLCYELRLSHPPIIDIEPRVADDPVYRFLERTWMLQQLPWALFFYAWGGWAFVFWGVCARVTAGVFGHWLIGYLAHNQGEMRYEVRRAAVQGRNVRLASLLTMGECWHNNHHAFPGSARLGLHAGEWDPGWWVLDALRRSGLIWDVRLPQDLAPRPELVALGDVDARTQLRTHTRKQPEPISLGDAWRLCAEHGKQTLVWPAASLSRTMARSVVGPKVILKLRQSASRLQLFVDDAVVTGLPALCIALARRNAWTLGLAAGLLPAAVGIERMRYRLGAA